MYYYKFLGRRHPSNVSGLTVFESPKHASFSGYYEKIKEIMVDSEERGIVASDDYIERRLLIDPYQGMQVVGGVFLSDIKLISPLFVEVIEESYRELVGEILGANKAFYEEKKNFINENNDLWRKPHLDHQLLGWRTRFLMISYADLEFHVPYHLDENSYAYCRSVKVLDGGMQQQAIDVYHRLEDDVEMAFLQGFKLADLFLDYVSFLSFAKAELSEMICTGPSFCKSGQDFEVAIPTKGVFNEPVKVTPQMFESKKRLQNLDLLSLRHFRMGISANSATHSFASLWNCLEQQAEAAAKANKNFRVVECKKCGEIRNAGFNTKSEFQRLYSDANVDIDVFDQHRRIRGEIQHGGKIREANELHDLLGNIASLQATAGVSLAQRTGLLPEGGCFINTSISSTRLTCRYDGHNFSVRYSGMTAPTSLGKLPQKFYGNGRSVRIGMFGSPPYDSRFIPPLI